MSLREEQEAGRCRFRSLPPRFSRKQASLSIFPHRRPCVWHSSCMKALRLRVRVRLVLLHIFVPTVQEYPMKRIEWLRNISQHSMVRTILRLRIHCRRAIRRSRMLMRQSDLRMSTEHPRWLRMILQGSSSSSIRLSGRDLLQAVWLQRFMIPSMSSCPVEATSLLQAQAHLSLRAL